jgi:hypothetical protein
MRMVGVVMAVSPGLSGLGEHACHGLEGGLRPAGAVEQERVVGAFPGPGVEPAVAVGDAPERDAVDVPAVGDDRREDLAVDLRLAAEAVRPRRNPRRAG